LRRLTWKVTVIVQRGIAHAALPGSARLGLLLGVDAGWRLIQTSAWLGLATNFRTPDNLPIRPGLHRVDDDARHGEASIAAAGAFSPLTQPPLTHR
jgi:hypothetical protein